jgi:DNA invertase Pin-like site-specific DNA recombinase
MDIIKFKGAEIVKKSEDSFSPMKIRCKNSHVFEAFEQDITFGEWCPECKETTVLEGILNRLKIVYEKNKIIGEIKYKISISEGRKFVILDGDEENLEKMCKNADTANYSVIIIENYETVNIEKNLWDAIRNNKGFVVIRDEKKSHKEEGICSDVEDLTEDGTSVVKKAKSECPDGKQCAIGYIRVSTKIQVDDGYSLEAQEAKIYKECKNRDLFCKRIYIDKGISGGTMEKRHGMKTLMSTMEENDWIISASVSRLSRDAMDLMTITKGIEKKKCHLVLLDLNIDLTTPAGKLILNMMGGQAQFEREIISERVKAIMHYLEETGKLVKKPKIGWKVNPDKSDGAEHYIVNSEEIRIVEQIRSIRNTFPSMKITEFANVLNLRDVKTPRKAKMWYHTSLKTLMNRHGMEI